MTAKCQKSSTGQVTLLYQVISLSEYRVKSVGTLELTAELGLMLVHPTLLCL